MVATTEQFIIPEREMSEASRLLGKINKSALAYVARMIHNAYWFTAQNQNFLQDFERRAGYKEFVQTLVEAPETIGAPPLLSHNSTKVCPEPNPKKPGNSWLSYEI